MVPLQRRVWREEWTIYSGCMLCLKYLNSGWLFDTTDFRVKLQEALNSGSKVLGNIVVGDEREQATYCKGKFASRFVYWFLFFQEEVLNFLSGGLFYKWNSFLS